MFFDITPQYLKKLKLKVFNSINQFFYKNKTIVTIGTFDGVHLGHQKVLKKLVFEANLLGFESTVLTFFPHPRMVLSQEKSIKLINTITEKSELLASLSIQNLIIHPFDEKFSNLTAEAFVKEILVGKFNVGKIIIGHDHRFGKNRTANINDLINFGIKYNFEVEEINAEEINAISISSTKIRIALENGNIKLANSYLGYNYFFNGTVVSGKKIGRKIGFPTANITVSESYKLIPKAGVYIVSSIIEGVLFYGMMNIGKNPTFGENPQTIEVHFFNLNEDLYHHFLKIKILDFIRDETKFITSDDLQKQLKKDKEISLAYIEKL